MASVSNSHGAVRAPKSYATTDLAWSDDDGIQHFAVVEVLIMKLQWSDPEENVQ